MFSTTKKSSIQFKFNLLLNFFSLSLPLSTPNNELVSWKFDLCPFHCVLFSIETYIIPKRFQWWWREREKRNFRLIKFLLDYNWYDNMAENRKIFHSNFFHFIFLPFVNNIWTFFCLCPLYETHIYTNKKPIQNIQIMCWTYIQRRHSKYCTNNMCMYFMMSSNQHLIISFFLLNNKPSSINQMKRI